MPEPINGHCPKCHNLGSPRAVRSIPGDPWVTNLTMVCETCHHEWIVAKRDPMEILEKTEA